MWRFVARMGCALLVISGAASAHAAIFYSFDPTSAGGQNFNVSLGAGASSNLSIYLVFTGTDATNLSAEKGLFGADVAMVRTGAVPSQPAGISSAAAVQGNAAFDDPLGPVVTYTSSGDVDLLQSIDPLDLSGVTGTAFGPGSQMLKLGTFTFTAGNILGQTTTFQAQDTPGFSDTVTFLNNQVLDGLIGNATVTFNVTAGGGAGGALPLPSGLAGGLALMAMLFLGNTVWSRRSLRAGA